MIKVYTAQYRYSGKDRLDITVKGATFGKARYVAPTWDMVMGIKNGIIDEEEYTRQYNAILDGLNESWWKEYLPSITVEDEVTLICYCRKDDFCHRVLLAKWLANKENIEYKGER